jgi:predicted site-specific integrase-resolvase
MPVVMPEGITPRLLTEEQASRYLGISLSTTIRWRKKGQGPAFLHVGGILRYPIEQLDKFIDDKTRRNNER